jgi:hypothetical protein
MFTNITVMAAVAAFTLSSAIAHAQSNATPSLAEVARQTAAKWATGKRATKVYTNASLAVVPEDETPAMVTVATATPATVNTPTSQPAAAAAVTAPGKDQAAAARVVEDENAWRAESEKNRRDLDQARAALDAARSAVATGTETERRAAERTLQHAQRTFEYYEKRWNAHVKAAEAAKVSPAWLQPKN